ncbi:MAG: intermembrane transport protein PqiB [Myxococcota bacterium]|nr:intermembrane transport protein PqiB [Myxococcota bacterium]
MAEAKVSAPKRRRLSPVWVVPIVAVLLGAWMVFYTWQTEGPSITLVFATAEGIEAGKTKVKARSVEMGVVETVELGEDLESVVVTAKLERGAIPLLREDTQFWVVRARIGMGGISGLGTVLSGGYIEMTPGAGKLGRREFRGLDLPPVTPANAPGLHLTLLSERAGSVSTGDGISYRGFRVGRIESSDFDVASQQMRYGAFIEEPYDSLVSSRTRFWNASGITVSATAEGFELQTGSLQSVLFGGISFGLPEGVAPGAPVEDGASFRLFRNPEAINVRPHEYGVEYVVKFARSVRGLLPGAPVEYRGLRSGQVERILLRELVDENEEGPGSGQEIPVLIRLEPGLLEYGDTEEGVAFLEETVETAVANGLRASLSTGSLLTGSLYVALDMHPDEPPAEIGRFAGRPTIPTVSSGLEALEQRIAKLLDKVNALPLDDVTRSADATLRSADDTLVELRRTVAELRLLIASEDFQQLPRSVETSLAELDRTLRSVNALAKTLEDQPNALVFPREHVKDPEPLAGSP